ncbi:MAG: hypothetical protein AAF518_19870 [Spirochaetota bacterium]
MMEWKDKIPDSSVFLKLIRKLQSHSYLTHSYEKEFVLAHRFVNSFFKNKLIASDQSLKEAIAELEKWVYNSFTDFNYEALNQIYKAGLAQIAMIHIIYTYQLFPGEELVARAVRHYRKKKYYKLDLAKNLDTLEKKNGFSFFK